MGEIVWKNYIKTCLKKLNNLENNRYYRVNLDKMFEISDC